MVKTRKGRKRSSPITLEAENEGKNAKVKKSELNASPFINTSSNNDDPSSQENCSNVNYVISNNEIDVSTNSKWELNLNNMSDSDESSSDEFMKAPLSLENLGDFKLLKNKSTSLSMESELEFSVGPSRPDDSVEDVKVNEHDYYDFSQIIKLQNDLSNTKKELDEKANNCKKQVNDLNTVRNKKYQRRKSTIKKDREISNSQLHEGLEITELLALAEGPTSDQEQDSSDDEVINEKEYVVPKEGVQITIELPDSKKKTKSKAFDLEAAMKRRLNLIRKENQVFMHKVHTLCWLSHGLYLNSIINRDDLMGLALSLIPSKHCYPAKHADLNYLEKLVEWFVGKVTINDDHKLAQQSSHQLLKDVLELQINLKTAFCKRDLVLIFVCMVRSLGIDARLVISLRPVPLRPPLHDLYTAKHIKPKDINKQNTPSDSITCSKKVGKVNNKITTQKEQRIIKTTNNLLNHSNMSNTKTSCTREGSSGNDIIKYNNKKDSKVTSKYFSSSDEISLKELQQRYSSANKRSDSRNNPGKVNQSSEGLSSEDKKSSNNCKTKSSDLSKADNFKLEKKISKRKSTIVKSSRFTPINSQEVHSSSGDEVETSVKKPKKGYLSKKSKEKILLKNKKIENIVQSCETKKTPQTKKSIDRRVLSSDDDNDSPKKVGNDFWAEVFLEAEEKWISVDLIKGKVHCIHQLYVSIVFIYQCISHGILKHCRQLF